MAVFDFLKKAKWQYVLQGNTNVPIWSTGKDKQYVTEAYNRIVWVYACVSAISSATSSVPWLLYRKVRGGRLIEIQEHPILTMLNVKTNPYMSSKDFIDYWTTYLAIEGKFYAEYINPNMPTAMFPLYPHYMYPIPSQNLFIAGYEYRMDKAINYLPEEILWSKFNDPLDIYQGLSPIKSLSRTIDTENEAVDWNKSTLQNAGVPAGVFQVTNPSPELSQRLQEEWIKRYSGGQNSRKPLILNSDKASYLPLGLSPIDMDFLNQRKVNRIEICSAFGVPSQIVGDPEGQTYSNYGEAQKAFWENTIIAKYLDHIKDKLTQDLLPRYADNLELRYDLSNVQALKENEDMRAKRVSELFKLNLLTRNEARYELDYEEVDDENVFYQDTLIPEVDNQPTQTPIAQETMVEEDMNDSEDEDDTDDEEIVFLIPKKKSPITNFPSNGENLEISLRNSQYPLFPKDYAEDLRTNHPSIWAKGGNIQGNDTYRVLKRILDENKTSEELTENDKNIIKMREAWSARHYRDFRLAGVVAQIKWLTIGSRGIDHMKEVIQNAKDKEKKYLNISLSEQERFYKNFEKKRTPYYKDLEEKIKKRFDNEIEGVLKELSKNNKEDLYQNLDNYLNKDIRNWESLFTASFINTIDKFGKDSFNSLYNKKENNQFNVYDEEVKQFIANSVAEDIKRINNTTKTEIKNIINDGISQGLPIGKKDKENTIAFNIYNKMNDISDFRSRMIARTETVSASNAGSIFGAKQTGLKLKKKWIPTFDDSTRDSHLSMSNSNPIGLDEYFNVGNSSGKFPGDSSLSAKERINCRCTLAYDRSEISPEIIEIDKPTNIYGVTDKIDGKELNDFDFYSNASFEEILEPNNPLYGTEDVLLKKLYINQKYDSKPDIISDKDLFEKYVKEESIGFGYRGVSSKVYIEKLKKGDYFAGTGYSGSGTYTAFVPKDKLSDEKQILWAFLTAESYGNNIIKYALKPNTKVIKLDDIRLIRDEKIKILNSEYESFFNSLTDEKKQALTYYSKKLNPNSYNFNTDYLGASFSDFQNNLNDIQDSLNGIELNELLRMFKAFGALSDTGRLATTLGYDAIYNKSQDFMIILNRSSMVIFKDNIDNTNYKKMVNNSNISRLIGNLVHTNSFRLPLKKLDELVQKIEKYDTIESMPNKLQEKIKEAELYYNVFKDYSVAMDFNSFLITMMED